MYKRLANWSCARCVVAGRRVHARLGAEPPLSEVTAGFGIAQDSFETRVTAHENAVHAMEIDTANFKAATENLEDRLRDFGLGLLSVTRGHHDAEPYLVYYPAGYGEAVRLEESELRDFADLLLTKLAQESDPWLLSFRERIQAARERYGTAQEQHEACARAEREAFAFRENEKRCWIRALSAARHQADAVYFWDPARVREIFSPVASKARSGEAEEPETPEVPGPSAPVAAAGPAGPGAPPASAPTGSPGGAPASSGPPAPGATPPTSA